MKITKLFSLLFIVFNFLSCSSQQNNPQKLIDDPVMKVVYKSSSISSNGNLILYVYSEKSSTNQDPKTILKKSTDNGLTWNSIKIISQTYDEMKIVTDGTKIFILARDTQTLKLLYSSNGGTSWDFNNYVGSVSSANPNKNISIILNNNELYISYISSIDEVTFAKSTNNGTSWTTTTIASNGYNSHILTDNTKIYITYEDFYGKTSIASCNIDQTSNISNWTKSAVINLSSLSQKIPVFIMNSNYKYIAYEGIGFNISKCSDSDCNTSDKWSTLSRNFSSSTAYFLSLDSNDLYITFYNYSNDTLFISKSIDNGSNWNNKSVVSFNTSDNKNIFHINMSIGSDIHLIYELDYQIYYKKISKTI